MDENEDIDLSNIFWNVNKVLQELAMSFGGHMRTLLKVGYAFGGYNLNNGNSLNRE